MADRGFTLVELMIVVAIIGVLAALAVYGTRRYLNSAKSAEAKLMVGNISRSAHSSYTRELMAPETVPEGQVSTQTSNQLCASAAPVPASVPPGKKYQPSTQDNVDFKTGDDVTGWKCLRFSLSQPTYFQLRYTQGSSPVAPSSPSACSGACYEAGALGDLDGNGVFSRYARTGHINQATGVLKASSTIYVFPE